MGAGQADSGPAYVEPVGRKIGVTRPDGSDMNMRTGVTGVS